jgi:hypothetical protein
MPKRGHTEEQIMRARHQAESGTWVLDEVRHAGRDAALLCSGRSEDGTFQRSRTAKKVEFVDVTFQGHLCAVAMASESMMSEVVKDKALDEIATIRETFTAMMRGSDSTSLGELDALRRVRRYRVRVRCALLPWEALQEACNAA